MGVLKVLLLMIVSIVISGVESFLIYEWLLNTKNKKQQFSPFTSTADALIGAALSGIVLATINTSLMYWITF